MSNREQHLMNIKARRMLDLDQLETFFFSLSDEEKEEVVAYWQTIDPHVWSTYKHQMHKSQPRQHEELSRAVRFWLWIKRRILLKRIWLHKHTAKFTLIILYYVKNKISYFEYANGERIFTKTKFRRKYDEAREKKNTEIWKESLKEKPRIYSKEKDAETSEAIDRMVLDYESGQLNPDVIENEMANALPIEVPQ